MNYIADYRGRTDLISNYGSNSLLLYALQLRFDLSDIASVASESLTDGSNDKKCDLIYAPEKRHEQFCRFFQYHPALPDAGASQQDADLSP